MKCIYHPEAQAFNTCCRCGEWLCDSCSIAVDGRVVCKRCVANAMSLGSGTSSGINPGPPSAPPGHFSGGTPGFRTDPPRSPKPRRYVSALWIFMLSCLPGLNYMAMGLMKRGLFFMSTCFGLIYLMSVFHALTFPLVILFFASLCDAQNKRRRINNGEYVSDDIDDIIRFAIKYKTPLLVVLVFLILGSFFGPSGILWRGSGHLLVLMIVCLIGWYFINNRAKRISGSDDHHTHDHDSHN